jgi:hypothetical protein
MISQIASVDETQSNALSDFVSCCQNSIDSRISVFDLMQHKLVSPSGVDEEDPSHVPNERPLRTELKDEFTTTRRSRTKIESRIASSTKRLIDTFRCAFEAWENEMNELLALTVTPNQCHENEAICRIEADALQREETKLHMAVYDSDGSHSSHGKRCCDACSANGRKPSIPVISAESVQYRTHTKRDVSKEAVSDKNRVNRLNLGDRLNNMMHRARQAEQRVDQALVQASRTSSRRTSPSRESPSQLDARVSSERSIVDITDQLQPYQNTDRRKARLSRLQSVLEELQ